MAGLSLQVAYASSKWLKLSSSPISFIFNAEIDEKGAGPCLIEQHKSAKEVIASDMSGKKEALSFGNIYN